MKKTSLCLLVFLVLTTKCVTAQAIGQPTALIDSLNRMSSTIWKQKNDSSRLQASNAFFSQFQLALQSPSLFRLPFDSIFGITRVANEDGNLRIFTWNIPLVSGDNQYFGFIQILNDSSLVIPLRSFSNQPSDFEMIELNKDSWYGALYYNLIPFQSDGVTRYILLGWDGFTANSNRKMIEVLTIDRNGKIKFGMPVFKTDKGIKARIVLEYAEKANMLLRYDYQSIRIAKKKKIQKKETWLIVMDRLVPMDASMSGFRKYYVPSGDTYDGYMLSDGFWVLVEDIDVANKVILPEK